MIQLQFPEFLILAVPLAFVCWRWGSFRPEWNWLLPIVAWAAAATWLFSVPWWADLWLVIPVALWLRPWVRQAGMTGVLRLAAISLLLVGLTGPEWDLGGQGIDLIVVADRSKSMPATAAASVHELIDNLENNRRTGDRVGVVTFGQVGRVEHRPVRAGDDTSRSSSSRSAPMAATSTMDCSPPTLVDKNRPAADRTRRTASRTVRHRRLPPAAPRAGSADRLSAVRGGPHGGCRDPRAEPAGRGRAAGAVPVHRRDSCRSRDVRRVDDPPRRRAVRHPHAGSLAGVQPHRISRRTGRRGAADSTKLSSRSPAIRCSTTTAGRGSSESKPARGCWC